MAETNHAARREALRPYVAEFVAGGAVQDEVIDAALGRSQTAKDDRWYAREEIAWLWIERLQSNPQQTDPCFDMLNRLFGKMVFGRIRGRLHLRSDGDAEQLTVDTFTRCFQQRHTLNRRNGSLGGFLQKVAGNLVIDWLRSPQSRPQVRQGHAVDGGSDGLRMVERSVRRREQAEAFWRNVVHLGPPHHTVSLLLLEYLQWRPAELVARWHRLPLDAIADWVESECRAIEEFASAATLDACFGLLHARLDAPVQASNPPEARESLGPVWDLPAGSVVFADYCAGDPAASVSSWSHRLANRVRCAKRVECPELFDLQA